MPFDDFDRTVTVEETHSMHEDRTNLCINCGTDHSNPDDVTACYADQEDYFSNSRYDLDNEPPGIDDDTDFDPYAGAYDLFDEGYHGDMDF